MDEIRRYSSSLNVEEIPWHRMLTAYGTAEAYSEILPLLAETNDVEEWKQHFEEISDFEHQSTMFPPAPFVLVFLVRILEQKLDDPEIAGTLLKQFIYYAEICHDADAMEHAKPLAHFSDLLDEQYLLAEGLDEEDLEEVFEDPDLFPDDLFYSFYYYSRKVLSEVPAILEQNGCYPKEAALLNSRL